jgi:molybdate transport system permease protein
MATSFIETLLLTARLATFTTLILLVVGLPVSYFMAYSRFGFKPLLEAMVSMP